MQDRNRSFLDIKSLFQSSRRSRSPTPPKTYHYKKKERSSNARKQQSTVTDEHTTYIVQRTLIDPHLSDETAVFRKLSVREPPPSSPPRSPRSSLQPPRSPRRSKESSSVFHSDAMSSVDSFATLHPAQFPRSSRSASPQLSQRRGGISPPELTPRAHPSSGLTVPPFSHVSQQTQNFTPRRFSLDKGDISYSRPTPFAYPFLQSRSLQNRPSVEWQPPPAQPPPPPSRPPEPIESSLSFHSRQRDGSGRPTMHHVYRDRMLVHASVNKNWGTQ